ncbi:MAG: helix-turn-helix domain-containing protein [Ferruginibacter sp.]
MEFKDTLIIQGVSREEFKSFITDAIKNEMQSQLQKITEQKQTSSDELLSKKEAAVFLRISLPTISKLVKEGVITCSRIGGSLRFKKSHLEKSLEQTKSRSYRMSISNSK